MFNNLKKKKGSGFAVPGSVPGSGPVPAPAPAPTPTPSAPPFPGIPVKPVQPVQPGFDQLGMLQRTDGRKEELMRLDEKLITAVKKYNIDGVGYDFPFFGNVKEPLSAEAVFELLKMLPGVMYELRLECVKRLVEFGSDAAYTRMDNERYAKIVVRNSDVDSIMETHPQDALSSQSYSYKHELYCYILRFLFENIRVKKLSEKECEELLAAYETINMHRFVQLFPELFFGHKIRPYKYGELDYRWYFKDTLDLLNTAYEAGADVSPYVYSVKRLNDIFTSGLNEIYFCYLDHNYHYLNNKSHPVSELEGMFYPVRCCKAATFYSFRDAEFLFDYVSKTDIIEKYPEMLDFLCDVVDHTDEITRAQGEWLIKAVESISVSNQRSSDSDGCHGKTMTKDECLIYIEHNLSGRRKRESVYKS